MHAIDCPIVSSSWTPAEPLDLSNAVEPNTAPPTSLSWAERAEHAAEVLAAAERDELLAAYHRQFGDI